MDAGIFIFFVINLGLSGIVAYVAQTKGRSPWAFFLLSFFFSFIVGIIVALAIAPGDRPRAGQVRVNCPFCMEQINALATVCRHCGKEVEPQEVLVENMEVERADKVRGAKMIIGVILVVIGGLLFLPNLVNIFIGVGVNFAMFFGFAVSAAFVAIGIINIKQARKSAKAIRDRIPS